MSMIEPEARLGDRGLFPCLEARCYLNHAAVSAPPSPVVKAVEQSLARYAGRGLGALPDELASRAALRDCLAELLGVQAEDLGFVSGTSAGLRAVALGFPWRSGDGVVLFEGDFPANTTPWQQAAERFGLRVSWLSAGRFMGDPAPGLADLDRVLAEGQALVAVSAVQFQTGLRMPIEAIVRRAHAHGAQVCVDLIQAAGVVPLQLAAVDVDYAAGGAHKWLMGVEGAGYLYVHPARIEALHPAVAGWLSHEDPVDFLLPGGGPLDYQRPLRSRADMVEAGSQAVLSLSALGAAVSLLQQLGVRAIYDHVQRYHDALEPELLSRGLRSARSLHAEQRSGILSVSPAPGGPDLRKLAAALSAAGVACSTPDGWLRFAPHWPNTLAEVPLVLAALDAAAS